MKKTTYQIVLAASNDRVFTQSAADLVRAPVGSIIIVTEMTDEEFAAIPATTASARFFQNTEAKE